MMGVVIQLVDHVKRDQQTARDADSQTDDVDCGVQLRAEEIANRNGEVIT